MVELNNIRYPSAEQMYYNNNHTSPISEAQTITYLEYYTTILEIENYNLFAALKDYLYHRNDMTIDQIKSRKDIITDIKNKIKLLK